MSLAGKTKPRRRQREATFSIVATPSYVSMGGSVSSVTRHNARYRALRRGWLAVRRGYIRATAAGPAEVVEAARREEVVRLRHHEHGAAAGGSCRSDRRNGRRFRRAVVDRGTCVRVQAGCAVVGGVARARPRDGARGAGGGLAAPSWYPSVASHPFAL